MDDAGLQSTEWANFAACVRTLPARMIAKLPFAMQADPQVRREVERLALEAVACGLLDTLVSDQDHPAFVTQIGQAINVGQPNADTIYRMARISPAGSYRIRGRLGSLRMFDISQAPPSPGEVGYRAEPGSRPNHDCFRLAISADGEFDVTLSAERPIGRTGDWWQLEPRTTKLLVRMVSADWKREQDPTLSIERVDAPITRARPSGAKLATALAQLPGKIDFIGPLFVGHVARMQEEGLVNALKVYDLTKTGGLATQFYYEGTYDLADDEALLVEVKAPAKCRYRSLILTNELYQTTDWINNHSSLNDAQAPLDADGVLRIVISARDPGIANWLDTAGNPRGVIQGRWAECDSAPVPAVRKLPFAEVLASLPAETPRITPQEREGIIRERRAAYLQRPLW